MKAPFAVLCALGSVVAIACFSERDASLGPSAAECSVPVTVIDSTHFIIAIRDFQFRPDSILVPVGATVTWVNCELVGHEPHTTTSDSAAWDSPELTTGLRFSHTFAAAGGFPYHCTPHQGLMAGKVVVQ